MLFFGLLIFLFKFFPIDKILTDFSGQPASWKSCFFYMSNTRSDHVLMFCLKVIEVGEVLLTFRWF